MTSLEETMIEKFRALPSEKQREALEFVSALERRGSSGRLKIFEEIDAIVNAVPLEDYGTARGGSR